MNHGTFEVTNCTARTNGPGMVVQNDFDLVHIDALLSVDNSVVIAVENEIVQKPAHEVVAIHRSGSRWVGTARMTTYSWHETSRTS